MPEDADGKEDKVDTLRPGPPGEDAYSAATVVKSASPELLEQILKTREERAVAGEAKGTVPPRPAARPKAADPSPPAAAKAASSASAPTASADRREPAPVSAGRPRRADDDDDVPSLADPLEEEGDDERAHDLPNSAPVFSRSPPAPAADQTKRAAEPPAPAPAPAPVAVLAASAPPTATALAPSATLEWLALVLAFLFFGAALAFLSH